MISKFWAELSNDYEKLFETEIGYDVIIYAGDDQNVKEIHAHSNILCARSQYFRTAFSNEWAEKRDGKFIFRKQNISPQLFNIILRFIYCGNIELKNLQGSENDPTKWNKDDIIRIKRELYRFIPLIRFYDIEPTDFFYKVYCYKDILPQDLIHDLLEYHIVPNVKPKTNLPPSRKHKLDSTLIKSNHLPLFASWIDKKDTSHYNRKNIPYDFKLLYRSSQDGIDTNSFHKNCDDKGATIWIAKIKNSTQLIGGYNPLNWDNRQPRWVATADSFIFNFINGGNISTSKVSYVKKQDRAVLCQYNFGPTMGNIYCLNNINWSNEDRGYGEVYPSIGIPKNFEVEDYEVFQVIKK
ncbi:unnamed protein product [Rhizophagus irregularis]|nr:unnamed protein product [Rhizophagus irregularis]